MTPYPRWLCPPSIPLDRRGRVVLKLDMDKPVVDPALAAKCAENARLKHAKYPRMTNGAKYEGS